MLTQTDIQSDYGSLQCKNDDIIITVEEYERIEILKKSVPSYLHGYYECHKLFIGLVVESGQGL